MASNHSIRASDQDRDRTASLLREHHAVGRLDPEEFAERLDRAMTAKTIDELEQLTADLPAIDLYPLPTASLPGSRTVHGGLPASYLRGGVSRRGHWHGVSGWTIAWGAYAAVMLACLALWAAGAPVPILTFGAIGIVLVAGRIISHRAIEPGGSKPPGHLPGPGNDELPGPGSSE